MKSRKLIALAIAMFTMLSFGIPYQAAAGRSRNFQQDVIVGNLQRWSSFEGFR